MVTQLSVTAALKEWAVAISALGSGQQCLIIRKGGIHEENHRFEVTYPEFLLSPSFEHQQIGLLRPELAEVLSSAFDEAFPVPQEEGLRFDYYAQTVSAFPITTTDQLSALSPFHIWNERYAEQRLFWRPRQALTAMVLRVYQLPVPAMAPWRDEYAGCKSWIALRDVVHLQEMRPVLSENDFQNQCDLIQKATEATSVQHWTTQLLEASKHHRTNPSSERQKQDV